ncbi:TIGR03960 family B12-binding radical SAM protein, partial [candidate division WOR-3 bacterium]|nr:TIGR03960 family B12-binding radical SAM protein [candidate division WOR-3 bacterium]
ELGMSNYGLRILYSIINRIPDTCCERCYAPWPDFGKALGERNLPLYALESKRPVSEFDILGISLQSELSYTNVLYLLDLCRLPLHRQERNASHPLVVAGGPCTVNPLPMADFIDAFVVGDGEDAVREISGVVASWDGRDRTELLKRLSRLEGLFVPGMTPIDTIGRERGDSPSEREDARYSPRFRATVRRRVVSELKEEDFPFPPLVPICEITHDRLTVEMARGCTRGCRFCQAGMMNRPVRLRSQESIVRLAERGIRASGWEEVSLLSLSALDYPNLPELVGKLNSRLKERRVSISLPSTRGEDFTSELALSLQEVKKAGLTFAPETASERLRGFVNKNISELRILESVRNALDAGWNGVKLYFMVGLPGETDADVAEIGRFVTEVGRLCKGRPVRFNLSPFVPKPHTPLQWAGFQDITETQAKIDKLRASITRRNVKAKWANPECSFVEALLARGDEKLGPVVEKVYREGGVFQEWTEFFRFKLWVESCRELGVDPQDYHRERGTDEHLPWEFINMGVSREFLVREYEKAKAGEMTPDCASGECTNCGACENGRSEKLEARTQKLEVKEKAEPDYGRRPRPVQSFQELRTRFRIKYAVEEPYQFAAHLDRVRAFYRSLRRSELPIAYTKGFAPKPMLSFGPPLPVGLLSGGEYLDLFTAYHYTGNILRDLGTFLPKGLRIVAAQPIAREHPSLGRIVNLARYDVTLPKAFDGDFAALAERAKGLTGVKELLPGKGLALPSDEENSACTQSDKSMKTGRVPGPGHQGLGTRDQGLGSEFRTQAPDPQPLTPGSVVLDLAIEPGIKLFDTLAEIFKTSDTEARCLMIRRRDCLVVRNGRIRTPMED